MAYDIGPKLGIDGYAEFRKAITDINDDVKMFGSELKLIAAIYDENGDSMEALSAKNEILGKTYEAQEKKVVEVSKVLERARAEYGDNETAVKKWEQVLIESKTALQKTQNEIEKNQQAMEELEKTTDSNADAFDSFKTIEAELQKALADIDDDVKMFGSELKLLATIYDDNGNSVEALTAKNAVLEKTYVAQEKKVAEVRVALEQAKAEYGDNETAIKKWEQVLIESKTALQRTQNEIEKNRQAIEQLGEAVNNNEDAVANLKNLGKVIDDIDDELKTLETELRAIASAYDETDRKSTGFKESQRVLVKQIEVQKEKLEHLQKGLQEAQHLYGENDSRTREWARAVNIATAELNDMCKELDSGNKGLSNFIGNLVGMSGAVAGNLLEGAGKAMSSVVSAVVDGAQEIISTFINLDESTEDYRVAMGKLKTAFTEQQETVENASVAQGEFTAVLYDADTALTDTWRTAETASEVYTKLYGILGDTDTAVEAAQLMVQMAESEENFTEWTRIAAGVAGTFGDALPINSLVEAANETVKVGEVTGALADALNWVGIAEDDFNAKLAECTTESERNDLIMQTLSSTYSDAADAFYENNEALIQSRENQAKLDEVTGRLGETVSDVKNTMMEKFGPAIIEIGEDIADFIEGVDTDKLFRKFEVAWDDITTVLDNVPIYLDSLGDIACGTFETIDAIWRGDFDTAWQNVKEVFSDSYDFFSNLGEDIANAMAAGIARRNREENEGTFGQDTDRTGSFGGSGGSGGSGDSGGGRAEPAPIIHSTVYLDGKRVGAILNSVNDASRIASGADISLLT